MTFIPSGDSGTSITLSAVPVAPTVVKSMPVRKGVFAGESVDLLDNGEVVSSNRTGDPNDQILYNLENGNLDISSLANIGDMDTTYRQFMYVGDNKYIVAGRQNITNSTFVRGILFEVDPYTGELVYIDTKVQDVVGELNAECSSVVLEGVYRRLVIGFTYSWKSPTHRVCYFYTTNGTSLSSSTITVVASTYETSFCKITDTSFCIMVPKDGASTTVYVVNSTGSGFSVLRTYSVSAGGASANPQNDSIVKVNDNTVALLHTSSTSPNLIFLDIADGTTYAFTATFYSTTSYGMFYLSDNRFAIAVGATSNSILNIIEWNPDTNTYSIFSTTTEVVSEGYYGGYLQGVTLQGINNKIWLRGANKVGLWDFTETIPVKIKEITNVTGANNTYGNIMLDKEGTLVGSGFSGTMSLIIDEEVVGVSDRLNAYEIADTIVSGLNTTRCFAVDSTNVNLIDISTGLTTASTLDSAAHSISGTLLDVSAIDNTRSVILSETTTQGTLRVAKNDADTVVIGGAISFGLNTGIFSIDAELVLYTDDTDTKVIGVDYSDTSVSFGSPVSLEASIATIISNAKIDANTFLCTTEIGNIKLVTLSGTTATIVDSIQITASAVIDQLKVIPLTSTTATVLYRDTTRSSIIYGKVITLSGSTLSIGNDTIILPSGSSLLTGEKVNENNFIIYATDSITNDNKVLWYSVLGDTINLENIIETPDNTITKLSSYTIEKCLASTSDGIYVYTLDTDTFSIAKKNIGSAKSISYDGATVPVELFGISIKTGFTGLRAGYGLTTLSGDVWSYAISSTEVIQLEA